MADNNTSWRVSPFLHFKDKEIYNPLSDTTIRIGESLFQLLQEHQKDNLPLESLPPGEKSDLMDQAWIAPPESDLTSRYYLKYASIETHTVCNQSCRFCPVSIAPREPHFMPTALFDRIIMSLAGYRTTLKAVFLNNYNEPTLDKRIIDQVRTIKDAGLSAALLTNGTELTPEKIDALLGLGALAYLGVNIASIQREQFMSFHGKDHLERVIQNLDYAKDRRVAERMAIVVLGDGGDEHAQNYEAICKEYGHSCFEVRIFRAVDRAGFLEEGWKPEVLNKKLRGCEEMGSRPLQHIHVNAHGQCMFCCQDYKGDYIVGDLNQESVGEVLAGPKLSLLRAQAYGLKQAPDDFICRKCVFSLTG